jgi:hypothetical protein
MRRSVFRSLPALALPAALALAACDGSTPPRDDLISQIPDWDLHVAVQEHLEIVATSATANLVILDALRSLGIIGDPQAAALAGLAPMVAADAPVVPADLLGTTVIIESASVGWRVDGTRTDAPADALRVIWYPTTGGQIMFTQQPRGHIDIRNENGLLGIVVTRTLSEPPIQLANFTLAMDGREVGDFWDGTLQAMGTWRVEERALHMTTTFEGQAGTAAHTTTIGIVINSDGFNYTFAGGETGPPTGTLTGTYDVVARLGGDPIGMRLELTQGATGNITGASGTISHRNQVVANIAHGSPLDFTRPDGGALNATDRHVLQNVVNVLLGPVDVMGALFLVFI